MKFKTFFTICEANEPKISNRITLIVEDIATLKSEVVKEYPERGYVIKKELWDDPYTGMPPIEMVCAYSLADNSYIGEPKMAKLYHQRFGISLFTANPLSQSGTVSSIGYSPDIKKWYGWSHRAIAGFKIGDIISKGDILANRLPIGYKAETEADCKNMAMLFADEVS